jgi:hypothetical protein
MLRDVALSGIKEPTIHTGSHNHSRNTIVAWLLTNWLTNWLADLLTTK